MNKNQLLIGLLSLCFSVVPFWSVSESAEVETAFDRLDEDVQDQLVFKRLMVEAIDTSLEINEALWFDSSSAWQRAAVVIPAYTVIRGTYFAQRGLMSDVRRMTPEARHSHKQVAKENTRLVQDLLSQESALKQAQEKLRVLKAQGVNEDVRAAESMRTMHGTQELVSQAELKEMEEAGKRAAREKPIVDEGKTTAVPEKPIVDEGKTTAVPDEKPIVDEGKTTAVPEKSIVDEGKTTAVPEKPALPADPNQTAQTDKGRAVATKSLAETRRLSRFLRRGKKPPPAAPANVNTPAAPANVNTGHTPVSTTAELISQQESTVKMLESKVSELRTKVQNISKLKLKNVFYRGGRLIRGVGLMSIVLGAVPVYVAATGETVMVIFNLREDMEALREQYVQDIEEVMAVSATENL